MPTTIGGLKHGLAREISSVKGENLGEIFGSDENVGAESPLVIGSEDEEIEGKKEKINENKRETLAKTSQRKEKETDNNEKNVWHIKVKKAVFEVNKSANGKFDFREVKKTNSAQDGEIAFEDKFNKNNRIKFHSPEKATVVGDINAYYAVCETAKRLGRNIRFGKFNNLERKALLYQACLEKGVKMDNEPNLAELKNCPNFAKIKQLKTKSLKNPRRSNILSLPQIPYENRLRA